MGVCPPKITARLVSPPLLCMDDGRLVHGRQDQEPRAGGERQGRGGQVDGRREPGAGHGRRRHAHRAPGCRRLRPVHPDDVRRRAPDPGRGRPAARPIEQLGIKLMSIGYLVDPKRRWSGAGRCSPRPSPVRRGRAWGELDTSSSTCRPAPATSSSRSRKSSRSRARSSSRRRRRSRRRRFRAENMFDKVRSRPSAWSRT